MTVNENIEGKEKTVYELSYIFLPNISDEEVSQKVLVLKEMIEKFDGFVVADENPIFIDLAYPMTKLVGAVKHKESSGHFGWVKFEMLSDGIVNLKKRLDSSDDILRYLIIKTVKENTLLNGKMVLKKEEKTKRENIDADEPIAEPTLVSADEDLDKSIDDLVIV